MLRVVVVGEGKGIDGHMEEITVALGRVVRALVAQGRCWDAYRIARHALIHGHHSLACTTLDSLTSMVCMLLSWQ